MSALTLSTTQDNIVRIVFDMPGSRANTLGQAMLAEWEQLLTELEGAADVRGLMLVSAKPGMFIAGADLKELGSAGLDSGVEPQARAARPEHHRPPRTAAVSRPSPSSTGPAWAAGWNWLSASTIAWPGRIRRRSSAFPRSRSAYFPAGGARSA